MNLSFGQICTSQNHRGNTGSEFGSGVRWVLGEGGKVAMLP